MTARYRLFYWPTIQGRGEPIRLALEDGGAPYEDVARLAESAGGGEKALFRLLQGGPPGPLPFAPPILETDGILISQTANILAYLGPRLGLIPEDETSRLFANQLALTVADLFAEAHDVHHPVGTSLYYEEQEAEARRRAETFREHRLPKFLGYFERVLSANTAGGHQCLVGSSHSYADLALFQAVEGLSYAFPRAVAVAADDFPNVLALRDRVASRPRVAAYLASDRRIPFNEDGIFRHYRELDSD